MLYTLQEFGKLAAVLGVIWCGCAAVHILLDSTIDRFGKFIALRLLPFFGMLIMKVLPMVVALFLVVCAFKLVLLIL